MENKETNEPEYTTEIDYTPGMIKKLTPYLNDITFPQGEKIRKPTLKQRAFAWYYVFNGGNRTQAWKLAYCRKVCPETGIMIVDKDISQKNAVQNAYGVARKSYVHDMINRIRAANAKEMKEEVAYSILDQLVVQATYDPAIFINPDGKPQFTTWDEIPQKYRCCVVGIDRKRYGKDGLEEIIIKLVDRTAARKELMEIAPGYLDPLVEKKPVEEKRTVIHKTVDKDGREVGIDFARYTDEELMKIAGENK